MVVFKVMAQLSYSPVAINNNQEPFDQLCSEILLLYIRTFLFLFLSPFTPFFSDPKPHTHYQLLVVLYTTCF